MVLHFHLCFGFALYERKTETLKKIKVPLGKDPIEATA